MKDLAKEFSIPGNVKCKKIYDDIWEIEKKSHKDPEIESIMSIIVSLKDKEHIKENLDDFALFILNKNSIDIQDSIKYNTDDLNELGDSVYGIHKIEDKTKSERNLISFQNI
jgi:hypothetical protein